jgi:hypothetical protein
MWIKFPHTDPSIPTLVTHREVGTQSNDFPVPGDKRSKNRNVVYSSTMHQFSRLADAFSEPSWCG